MSVIETGHVSTLHVNSLHSLRIAYQFLPRIETRIIPFVSTKQPLHGARRVVSSSSSSRWGDHCTRHVQWFFLFQFALFSSYATATQVRTLSLMSSYTPEDGNESSRMIITGSRIDKETRQNDKTLTAFVPPSSRAPSSSSPSFPSLHPRPSPCALSASRRTQSSPRLQLR